MEGARALFGCRDTVSFPQVTRIGSLQVLALAEQIVQVKVLSFVIAQPGQLCIILRKFRVESAYKRCDTWDCFFVELGLGESRHLLPEPEVRSKFCISPRAP